MLTHRHQSAGSHHCRGRIILQFRGRYNNQISGVLLGTFTGYEKAGPSLTVYDLLKMHISEVLPVACTRDIGHGHDAKAIMIGKEYSIHADTHTSVM